MIYLAIAEDHQSLIDGIQLLLLGNKHIQIVGAANNGADLLNVIENKKVDVVLTDIRMPIMDGITLTKVIQKTHPTIKVIAFTMYDQEDAIKQMLNAGATGYLLKNSPLDQVIKAVEAVYAGEKFYDANIILDDEDNTNKKAKSLLTNRQVEILKLIAQGKTSREIADELFIGVQTVDTHRKNMARILGLQGKGELMRYALERKYKF